MNINEMYQQAAEAPEQGDLLTALDLPAGTEVVAEIVYSKAGTTEAGAPSWTNKLRIAEGEHKGGEFFDSIYLSAKKTDGAVGYNKRQFAKLGAAGLGPQFFSSNPSADAIARALVDQKVTVKIKWQKPEGYDSISEALEEGVRVFGEHSWSPVDSTPAGGPAGFGVPEGY